MTIREFHCWVGSILFANSCMHGKRNYGMSADPEMVAAFDARAAELLQKARNAHDELATYLRSRKDDKT